MRPLLFELSAAPGLAERLARRLAADLGRLDRRHFPDGESYARYETPVDGRHVMLLCTLDRPDPKLAPLMFAAAAARGQGALSVGLIAPYLAYMRQDRQFQPGEAVTSGIFAGLLSDHLDWLVTLDPHLHRHPALGAIYRVPAVAATATGAIATWIADEIDRPIIVGPDEESGQWVDRIAELAGARSAVLRKERSGDYSVSIDDEGLDHLGSGTPVIVDDIASSANTLIEAARLIERHGLEPPVCAVVHAIFAGDAYDRLVGSGVRRVVSTNSIAHESNAIDICEPLTEAVRTVARGATGPER